MVEFKFGDKITWTEGSQMDKVTRKGIVTKVETIITIADEDGQEHELNLNEHFGDLKKGWNKK